MTESQFQELSIHDKGIWVFTNGKFISFRKYYDHKIDLYSLYGFFVEVYIDPGRSKIRKIEIVSISHTLNFGLTEDKIRIVENS